MVKCFLRRVSLVVTLLKLSLESLSELVSMMQEKVIKPGQNKIPGKVLRFDSSSNTGVQGQHSAGTVVEAQLSCQVGRKLNSWFALKCPAPENSPVLEGTS